MSELSELPESSVPFYLTYYWYDWAGYYDYAKYIRVKFDEKKLRLFTDFIVQVPFIIPYKGIAFISEKPKISWLEGNLHSEADMAIKYPDGYGFHFLHGICFDEKLWQSIVKRTISARKVFKLKNAEQRAMAIKVLGAEKLIKELGGKVIDKRKYNYGIDYLIELKGFKDGTGEPYKFLKGYDPAEKDYVYIRTHPRVKNVQEAHNFCYRLQMFNVDYNPSLRT